MTLSVAIIALAVGSMICVHPAKAETSSPRLVMIEGSDTLASASIDFCSALHLSQCPISFSITASYKQPVTVRFGSYPDMLQSGTAETVQATIDPGAPSLTLNFTFGLGSNNYTYTYPLPTIPVPGSYTYTIPFSLILGGIADALSLGALSPFLSLVSLNFPLTVSSSIESDIIASGFHLNQTALTWVNPGTTSYNSTLTGTSADSSMGLSGMSAVFSFGAQLLFGVPILGNIQLYSFQRNLVTFGSADSSVPIGDWYHVLVQSSYSETSGSAWYAAGSIATISVTDSTVRVSGQEYDFKGWTGTGTGSYSGSQQSYSIPVMSPMNETADWAQLVQNTAGLSGGLALAAVVTGIIGIVAVAVIAIIVVARRKSTRV